MQNIKELLNQNIIGLLGLESLPENEKIDMLNKMSELVIKRLTMRVVETLSPQDQKTVADMPQDAEQILSFVAEKVPNFMDLMNEEVVRLKQELLDAANK